MLPAFAARLAMVPVEERDAVRDRWVRVWSRTLLELFGVRAIIQGVPTASAHGRLVVANHRSTADILLLLGAFGGAMVSRADVAGWPLIGAAARAVGTVFVDRSSAFSGATAVRTIRARLSRSSTVVVFPEGGTSAGDEVRDFRPGAFVAALRAQADVVPVGLAYESGYESFPAHLARMAAAAPSRVAMCIGAAIPFEPSARAHGLRDRAHAEVATLVAEARRIVDAAT
jgi:1-acyl-sn-glycerol-3-phosphate acyltransferase